MPQNNPPPADTNKSDTFSQGFATGDFVQTPGPGSIDWFISKTFTIPQPFTSIEIVFHIRAINGSNVPLIFWYSEMLPGENFVTKFDGLSMTLPTAVGAGGANYPGVSKIGIGPAMRGLDTNTSGGNLAGLPNFVPYLGGLNIGTYIDTSISSPVQWVIFMAQTPADTPPDIDGTLYNTFYK